jgi:hypothetical protein
MSSRGRRSSRLVIVTPDVGLIPDAFPLPHSVDLEEDWRVAVTAGVDDPWVVNVAPTDKDTGIGAAVRLLDDAPEDRTILLQIAQPALLSDSGFLIDVVGAALAIGPGVIIKLADD